MASVDSSMTGVPVTPSGSILPHGNDDLATGLPSDRFQTSARVPASIAWTTLSSVARISIAKFDPGARQWLCIDMSRDARAETFVQVERAGSAAAIGMAVIGKDGLI